MSKVVESYKNVMLSKCANVSIYLTSAKAQVEDDDLCDDDFPMLSKSFSSVTFVSPFPFMEESA